MQKLFLKFLIVFSSVISLNGFGIQAKMNSGDSLYRAKAFEEALQKYEEVNKEYESANLYYNMGNAYFQLDNLPYAILYYEKAKKLGPSDPDILFNLNIANQKVVDKVNINKSKLNESIHRFLFGRSVNFWPRLSVICSALGFILLAVYMFVSTKLTRLFSFYLGIFFLAITTISIYLSSSHVSIYSNENEAIIVAPKVDVKNAPLESGKDLFILHEGTKVNIKKSDPSREWYEIAISSSNVGWIKKEDIEII